MAQWLRRTSRDSISTSESPPSSLLSDDVGAFMKPSDPPNLSRLFSAAAEYHRVLAGSDCLDSRSHDSEGSHGFADLVGRDLDSTEQAAAGHVARLRATRYSWGSYEHFEPDSYDHSKILEDESEEEGRLSEPHSILPPDTEDSDSEKLEPVQIIHILIDEFGPLASEDENERLILETDGCMISQDVFIVGVIHVTTHRLAFHASLLSTQSEVSQTHKIIKDGPAVVHRRGWRSRRRVWMELSHDMLCIYTSSKDDAKTHPLCTLLLTFINKILPFDPQHPRHLRLKLGPGSDRSVKLVEYDTEESARDWRREISGAIFLYRHRRREAFGGPGSDPENNGIRLSCSLNRINQVRFGAYPDFPCIASLSITPLQSDEPSDETDISEPEIIHLGTIKPRPLWIRLEEYVSAAKQRPQKRTLDHYPVFIDFGSLSFHEAPYPWDADDDMSKIQEKTIRRALSLDAGESQLWIVRSRIYRSVSSAGYLVVSSHFVCFWSKSLNPCDIKHRIPVSTIKSVKPIHVAFSRPNGLVLEIKGNVFLKLVFRTQENRDEAITLISRLINGSHTPSVSSGTVTPSTPTPLSPTNSLKINATGLFAPLSRSLAAATHVTFPTVVQIRMPKAINLPHDVLLSMPPMHFVCLTIGSRGDVQPYIALGLGLKKEGHRVTIATHEEYKNWIEGFGIEHRTTGGDPGALMKLSVEHRMFSPEFFKESISKFRPWLDQHLADSWEACKSADVLLESPSAMAGVHIAEALNIPYFRTFTMPWTKTVEFPHAFLSTPVESPAFNSASYILFSNVLWAATSRQINRWRRHTLKISNTDMGHLAQSKIIFIYNFSQAVVPKPLDWGDTTIISGYWFLDNPDLSWSPSPELLAWMAKARRDGKPIVYIGFGSITVPDANRVATRIINAVVQSGVRAIISKGWSTRMSKATKKTAEPEAPPECFMVDKIPHDWLFPQIDAALHHGGAGTTGASLRAGIPTLIKPWFGDQFFWGARVQKLGAGLRVPSLRVSDLSDALIKATTSITMKEKAAAVGERIRSEDGVRTAIHTIYTYLPRASLDRTSLTK